MIGPRTDVLIVAGLQVPVMPLLEVSCSAGATAFRQSGPIASKTGITASSIVISIVNGALHKPAVGVKVYGVVPATLVLITAGDHVPVIPLLEVTGNVGAVVLRQIAPIASKIGATVGLTVTSRVWVVAHCPGFGVKT